MDRSGRITSMPLPTSRSFQTAHNRPSSSVARVERSETRDVRSSYEMADDGSQGEIEYELQGMRLEPRVSPRSTRATSLE